MHVDAAHEFEPRAGPRGLNRRDVPGERVSPGQRDFRIDIDAAVVPALLKQRVLTAQLSQGIVGPSLTSEVIALLT